VSVDRRSAGRSAAATADPTVTSASAKAAAGTNRARLTSTPRLPHFDLLADAKRRRLNTGIKSDDVVHGDAVMYGNRPERVAGTDRVETRCTVRVEVLVAVDETVAPVSV